MSKCSWLLTALLMGAVASLAYIELPAYFKQEAEACALNHLADIKKERSLRAMRAAFHDCDTSIAYSFRPVGRLSEGLRYGIFLTQISSHMAPYGNTSGMTDVSEILSTPFTNCGPQSVLVMKALYDAYPDIRIQHVGFINPKLGFNHAVIYAQDDSGAVLLDPTAATIALVKLDTVIEGHPVDNKDVVDYYDGEDDNVLTFAKKYRDVLSEGKLSAGDVVYNNPVKPGYYGIEAKK